MYKKVNVVMLPTNEKADLQKFGKSLRHKFDHVNSMVGEYQHLYITNDDKIKEGNWYIDFNEKPEIIQRICKSNWDAYYTNCKKIIATTDSFLMITKSVPHSSPNNVSGKRKEKIVEKLPQIPQQFIEHFVSKYNKGNVITEVMVEFESYHGINTSIAEINAISGDDSMNWKGIGDNRDFKLKINQDNTINIKPVKDWWSREEVKTLIKEAIQSEDIIERDERWMGDILDCVFYKINETEFNKWIEENL